MPGAWVLAGALVALGCAAPRTSVPTRPRPGATAGPRPPGPRAAPLAPSLLRVGTWNLKRLGHGSKRLDLVADVIDERFDVIALEEVMTARGVAELVALLPGWASVVSERAVGRNGYVEHYAVLFRERAARVSRAFLVEDPGDAIVREPFVVCLDAARFDFCLVVFHATYTGGTRVRDAEILAVTLELLHLRETGREQDWLLVGDTNRPDTAPGFDVAHDAGLRCAIEPNKTATSIGLKKYTNAYDHVLLDPRHTREWTGRAERVDVVARPCDDDFAWCRDELSDHAPVVAEFRTDEDDDD